MWLCLAEFRLFLLECIPNTSAARMVYICDLCNIWLSRDGWWVASILIGQEVAPVWERAIEGG